MRFSSRRIEKNTMYYGKGQNKIKFLLGGIGAGNISLGGRGNLTDFEFLGSPNKGFCPPNTFFSIFCDGGNKKHIRIAESVPSDGLDKSVGFCASKMQGLPHFQKSRFSSRYPFAYVDLYDNTFPLAVSLQAYTPFVPLNIDASSYPMCGLTYTVKNKLNRSVTAAVCGSLTNPSGYTNQDVFGNLVMEDDVHNEEFSYGEVKGVNFLPNEQRIGNVRHGSMCLAASGGEVTVKPEWIDAAWQDAAFEFLDDLLYNGKLSADSVASGKESVFNNRQKYKSGSVCVTRRLLPNESASFTFYISWYYPNRYRTWFTDLAEQRYTEQIKCHYAYRFSCAQDVISKFLDNQEFLYKHSQSFSKALFSSNLPKVIIDAVASNLTVIRSNTCMRLLENGKFFAYEGSYDFVGSCDGNCQHVWNYAVALAMLFPEAEVSMRRTEFFTEMRADGHIPFRARQDLADEEWVFPPAVDGLLGCIIRLYREWKYSGGESFMREYYTKAVTCMEYCIKYWDCEDGIIKGAQHNTYDIEFYGYSSLPQTMLITALGAMCEMSDSVDDTEGKNRYSQIKKKAIRFTEDELFCGEYYIQKIDEVNEYKYQYGKGCLSDQLFGCMLGELYGIETGLDRRRVERALSSIVKNNFKKDFMHHINLQRVYAIGREKGLVMCSWKDGDIPKYPFVYASEVWTGVEYQVATHLALHRKYKDCLKLVRATRSRYNGIGRNPFNEIECGHHYARSLASFGLIMAFTGYSYDAVTQQLNIKPYKRGDFQSFFICGKCWGIYKRKNGKEQIEVLYGNGEQIVFDKQKK